MNNCLTTQGYYDNANPFYAQGGLASHGGVDEQCGYGTDIECPIEGYVYKILDNIRPASDGSGFWAIFILGQYKGQWGEFCVGHVSKINVNLKDKVTKGQIIGQEGNRGKVYYGTTEITKKMQDAGDKRGSHRHYQWRPCKKVQMTNKTKNYLSSLTSYFYRDFDDMAWEVLDYNNGRNGLSPLITDILKDYADEKRFDEMGTITINKVDPKITIGFLEVVKNYLKILIGLRK